jgi:hypothetical protein
MKLHVKVQIGTHLHEGVYQLPNVRDRSEAIAESVKDAVIAAARDLPDSDCTSIEITATILGGAS